MKCPECKQPFEARQREQTFCSKRCNTIAGNREMKRARALYRALYWWRYGRLARSARYGRPDRLAIAADLWFICREIKAWVLEDEREGRPPPPKHRHDTDRGHQARHVISEEELGAGGINYGLTTPIAPKAYQEHPSL